MSGNMHGPGGIILLESLRAIIWFDLICLWLHVNIKLMKVHVINVRWISDLVASAVQVQVHDKKSMNATVEQLTMFKIQLKNGYFPSLIVKLNYCTIRCIRNTIENGYFSSVFGI